MKRLGAQVRHRKDCRLYIAINCAYPIECEHGYDVCPTCDPCSCADGKQIDDRA